MRSRGSHIPTHGAHVATIFLQNKPINNGAKRRQLPVQILGLDKWVVLWEFRPLIARFPSEGWPIHVEFIGWVGKVGWRKNVENMRHLRGCDISAEEMCEGKERMKSLKREEVVVKLTPVWDVNQL